MTTIVYHKGILAADSRTSRKANIPFEQDRFIDDTLKLTIDYNGLFKDEKVIAITGTGDMATIKRAIAVIKTSNIEKLFSLPSGILGSSFEKHCVVMVITESNVHVLKIENSKLNITTFNKTQTVVLGNGHALAKFSIQTFDCSAVSAIAAASTTDPTTGGSVYWIDCINNPTILRKTRLPPPAQIAKDFQEKIKLRAKKPDYVK